MVKERVCGHNHMWHDIRAFFRWVLPRPWPRYGTAHNVKTGETKRIRMDRKFKQRFWEWQYDNHLYARVFCDRDVHHVTGWRSGGEVGGPGTHIGYQCDWCLKSFGEEVVEAKI